MLLLLKVSLPLFPEPSFPPDFASDLYRDCLPGSLHLTETRKEKV